MRYPFGSLPENLAAFCRTLSSRYGFKVGSRELQDAARALQVTSLNDERAVRDALRPVLSSRFEDVRVFDEAFARFFHPAPPQPAAPVTERRPSGSDAAARTRSTARANASPAPEDDDGNGAANEASAVPALHADDGGESGVPARLRSTFSPLAGQGAPPELVPVDAAWRNAARAFVRRLAAGRARTWRPAPRGPRFDLRRTLRTSLHTGGEWLLPRWRARPYRRPRFVVFLDGSRSMSEAVRPPMRLAVALATAASGIEVFAFSTDLRRITPDVRRAAAGEARRLPELAQAWGGGTSIGACLDEFARRFAERLIGRETVVVIASDGLDAGDPERLRAAMARLHRQAGVVIWLNPLVDTPGFQPTALGMRVARPYITALDWVEDAEDLLRLARTMRRR